MQTVLDRLLEMSETEVERRIVERLLLEGEKRPDARSRAWQEIRRRRLPQPPRLCW